MDFKYYNYEYFWCETEYKFNRKNIILNEKHNKIEDLPIIKHEKEPNPLNTKSLNNRTLYLHPKFIIKSPISNQDNHYYVLTAPYLDINKEKPFCENQILFTDDKFKPLPFNIFFTIRQKVKCTIPKEYNAFFIQKLIDEIIFIMKKLSLSASFLCET